MTMAQARVLCIGTNVTHLIRLVTELDSDLDIIVVACPEEGNEALLREAPYDVILIDDDMPGVEGALFLARLRAHSPCAVRVKSDVAVLRDAIAAATLRHRARALRASTIPRVTPVGAHPCCTYERLNTEGTWPAAQGMH